MDFFNYIATGFGLEKEFLTKGTFLAHFRKFLIKANEDKKKVLLIIDEAQLLTQEMLEEIRLLSNIEKTDAKLINIFFIGQNEFNEILNRDQNRAVRQRLTLNYNIDPLTPDETGEYIRHRLSVAGATYPIFNEEAIQEVFLNSGGFPRRINVICDHSLLSGYVKEKEIIDSAIVKECARELKIPSSIKNRDINGFIEKEPEVHSVAPDNGQALSGYSEVNSRKKKRFFLNFLIGLSICFFIVFYISPERFNKIIIAFKQQMTQIYQGGSVPPGKEVEKPNKEVEDDEKIHPIGESASKREANQNEIQTKAESSIKDGEKKIEKFDPPDGNWNKPVPDDSVNKDPLPNPDQIANEKKKSFLPTEKLVVRFRYDNNDFTDEALNKLINFSDILAQHPGVKIVINGYTDAEGYENYNQKLSEFRANIVRSFFLGRGIRPDQIEVIGSGSKNPIESNATAWGRTMNRRVEIEVKKQ